MGLISKLKPFPVDLFLYGFSRNSKSENPDNGKFPYVIEFCEKDSQFVIMHMGKQIHRSKLFTSSLLLNNFGFRQPYVAIGDCWTDEDYRGQRIYPSVIRHILGNFAPTHDVYMLVHPSNIASIKGIETAGLKYIARLQCLKIGPFYLRKRFSKSDK